MSAIDVDLSLIAGLDNADAQCDTSDEDQLANATITTGAKSRGALLHLKR